MARSTATAREHAERDLGPHRSQAEAVPDALPSPHHLHRHDPDARQQPDDPAQGPADRPFGATAETPEERVHRRDRLSAGDPPRDPAPHQEPSEGHDERRNAHVRDDRALERADRGSEDQPDHHRDDPRRRMVEPQQVRQPVVLNDRHDHADDGHHGADREVDVAGHDDQDHPRRHDRDDRGLDRQVPQVPRGEERVAAG